MTITPPSPPYLGPAAKLMHDAHGHPLPNKPINRIVVHSTVSQPVRGGARTIAAYFRSDRAGGSAHYVVDPYEVVQCVFDGVVAEHAPPNSHSLGIEMCDHPGESSTHPAPIGRWDDEPHRLMLARTARLAARLCLAYDVPIGWLSVADLKAGRHGITSHNNVSDAWHESSHWDPGAFPEQRFIELVQSYARKLRDRAARQ